MNNYKKIIKHRAYNISKKSQTSCEINWQEAEREYRLDWMKLDLIVSRMSKDELKQLINKSIDKLR